MKSEQTLIIEKALRSYDRATMCGIRINKFRPSHMVFEVPVECGTTKAGMVDCVEICEYQKTIGFEQGCWWRDNARLKCVKEISNDQQNCTDSTCSFNRQHEIKEDRILIICYEIKVSKNDFKKSSGHNFVGNLNYYVVPYTLYPKIKSEVPDDIGVILYYDGSQSEKREGKDGSIIYPLIGLKRVKECKFQKMKHKEQKWMILTVLKKIRKEQNT